VIDIVGRRAVVEWSTVEPHGKW